MLMPARSDSGSEKKDLNLQKVLWNWAVKNAESP